MHTECESLGKCECGGTIIPIWFQEDEIYDQNGMMIKTGRTRRACSHLTCTSCFTNFIVDDSFDGEFQ